MRSKQEILAIVQEGLKNGVITSADLEPYVAQKPAHTASQSEAPKEKHDKLSAVDVMFYIAGIILYAALLSVIFQTWEDGFVLMQVLLSLGVGTGFWSLAYYLIKNPVQNDVRSGLTNALLLTGSLSVITGGYILMNELIGGFEELNLVPGAIMLVVLGLAHLNFDRLIKKDFILLMGILLCVAAFPAFVYGVTQEADLAPDVYGSILIISAGLLPYAARVVAKIMPDRQKIRNSFDGFASLISLGTMYFLTYSDYGAFWYGVLILAVFGIFYLSIISRNKSLLGSASFFLVLTIITMSFKAFSGLGVTTSLIVATMGLLGTAYLASSLNKKYFKA